MTTTNDRTDAGPELPDVVMNLHTPKSPGMGVVVASDVCTVKKKAAGFVRNVSIDVSGTELAGKFKAGQAFGVLAPGTDEKGKPHKVRLYSLSCATNGEDGKGNVIATPVKRLIDEHEDDHSLFLGVTSNYLCDLKPGDEVKLTGPNGRRFLIPAKPEEHDYLFLATGTGIAPFRGMMMDLLEQGVNSQITLIMGSPYTTDLLFDDYFREMAEKHENVRYITAISREPQADGHGKLYVQDRFAANQDELVPMLSNERTLIYVCGLAGMETGIYQQMARLLPPEHLARYLTVNPEVMGDVDAWDRQLVKQNVKPTKRVFLEVY